MLPIIMKVVMVVAAGLFGTWQVAYLPAVSTYLTLPSYEQVQSYLTSVGCGKTISSFGMSETDNVSSDLCTDLLKNTDNNSRSSPALAMMAVFPPP
jgi:alkylation response protein AidB-like acyl-CoA dehydrogenase